MKEREIYNKMIKWLYFLLGLLIGLFVIQIRNL
jgi:hypothetical protein